MPYNHVTPVESGAEATSAGLNSRFQELSDAIDGRLLPTGESSDLKTTFSTATTRTNLISGEKLSISLGKIRKWFTDLATIAFSASYADLSDIPTEFNPRVHASTHGMGGSDEIEPDDIGALATSGNASNATVLAAPSETVINITSGDSLAVIVGKLMRWFTGLVASKLVAGNNITLIDDGTGKLTINSAGGGEIGGHTISNHGVPLPSEGTLNFTGGLGAADDPTNLETEAKLEFTNLVEETALADEDYAAIYDVSAGAHRKSLLSNLRTYILGTLFNNASGHMHNGTDSPKIAYSNLTGAPVLASVATSGSYTDLNNKPVFATVATSGNYTDLSGKPLLGAMAAKTLTEETVVLTAGGWSNKSQQVAVSNMTATAPGWYGPTGTVTNINAFDAVGIYLLAQSAGTMTWGYISDIAPAINISVDLNYFL